jgi:hypothetical protein
MAQIHLIGGEKGGVGKSLVARLLAQYLIDRERPFIGFDSDRSHGALMRFYAGFASPVQVDRYESLDAIVEAAVEAPDRTVLVDLAAQTQAPLQRWIAESGVIELAAELGINLRLWHVMDNGRDAVDLLAKALAAYGGQVQHVLVRNQLRGDNFALLEASPAWAEALALGAAVIDIKHLNDAVMHKIDASSSSFWAAGQSADKEATGLGMMDRQRVKVWLRDAYAGLDRIGA